MTDLFSTGADQPTIDPNKNYFEELVGEGKKFKDPVALARAKVESDAFIERIKRENEEMRQEIAKRASVEDFMTQLKSEITTQSTSNSNNQQGEQDDQGKTQAIDVEKLINEKLAEREAQRTHAQNLNKVTAELQKDFGSDFVNRLAEVTNALGLSKQQANHLAATAPEAFLTMVKAKAGGTKGTEDTGLFAPPRSTAGTGDSFRPTNTDRTKSWYDDLKSRDPKEYWSPKVQNQMHNDALRLGEKFFT